MGVIVEKFHDDKESFGQNQLPHLTFTSVELPGGDGEKIYNDLKMESMFYGMTAMFLLVKNLQTRINRVPVRLVVSKKQATKLSKTRNTDKPELLGFDEGNQKN